MDFSEIEAVFPRILTAVEIAIVAVTAAVVGLSVEGALLFQ